ncbi:mucin-binding protein, partial [Lactobacillus psittaci]|uniref:mucin-binding protein n=1 Tax=Lactobacillus psittaci TaxID=116089 RepID=UPI003B84AB92
MAEQKPRYGFRKFSVGLASALLATVFYFGAMPSSVKADVQPETETATKAVNQTGQTNKQDSDQDSSKNATTQNQQQVAPTAVQKQNGGVDQDSSTTNKDEDSEKQVASTTDKSVTDNAKQTVKNTEEQSKGSNALINLAEVNESSDVFYDSASKNNSNITLNDSSNHTLKLSLAASKGDAYTLEVPYVFDVSTQDLGQYGTVTKSTEPVTVTDFKSKQNFYNTTLKITSNVSNSIALDAILTPKISNWALLKPGTQFQVVLKKNGTQVGVITYTTPANTQGGSSSTVQPISLTAKLIFDQNQKTNLIPNTKYTVGVKLDGTNVTGNLTGTITVNVPEGFSVDTGSNTFGLYKSTTEPGGTLSQANTSSSDGYTISQAGGAGTPVTITFNGKADDITKGVIVLWGTYSKALTAAENKFSANVSYAIADDAGDTSNPQTITVSDYAPNLPVTNVETPKLEINPVDASDSNSQYLYHDAITDEASQTHKSDSLSNKYAGAGNKSEFVFNSGNTELKNVHINLDIEPGTVFRKDFGSLYGFDLVDTAENSLANVAWHLADGTVVNGSNTITSDMIAKGVKADGSNVTKVDIWFNTVQAGSSIQINYRNNGIITDKKTGDTAHYAISANADGNVVAPEKDYNLQIKDVAEEKINYSGTVTFPNGDYLPGDPDRSTAKIGYSITHSDTLAEPSRYLAAIPVGWDVADPSGLKLFYQGREYTGGKIKDLGNVGLNGERIFEIDVPFTPYWGFPIFFGNDQNGVNLVADRNNTSARYIYPLNKQSLISKIVDNPDIIGDQDKDRVTTITLQNGQSYKILPSFINYYYKQNWQEANYTFGLPSIYGQLDGIKKTSDAVYNGEGQTTSLDFGKKTGANDTGTLRVMNILNQDGTSKYSYNIVNLPDVNAGDEATLALTGDGVSTLNKTGDSANGTLLFSENKYTGDGNITSDDQLTSLGFKDASQITDWSKVKSIVLISKNLAKTSAVEADLGFKVTALKDGVNQANVNVQEYFSGDHNSNPYVVSPSLNVQIQRYVTVTTQYHDENGKDIKPATTQEVKSGDQYSTSGLTDSEIPANYKLSQTPTNVSGTAAQSDITVTYIYAPQTLSETVYWVDTETKDPDGQEGYKVVDSEAVPEQLEGSTYQLTKSTPTNYVLADGQKDIKSVTVDGNNVIIKLKHGTKTVPETRTVTRVVYVTKPNATRASKVVNTAIEFTRDNVVDAVNGNIVKAGDWDPDSTVINGYTPTKQNHYNIVIHKNSEDGEIVQSIDQINKATADTPSDTYYVTYAPINLSETVYWLDTETPDTSDKGQKGYKVVDSEQVPEQLEGSIYQLTKSTPANYVLADGQEDIKSVTVDGNNVYIKLKHGTKDGEKETKKVTRTVYAINPGETEPTQVFEKSVEFSRTPTLDAVTGDKLSDGTWTPEKGTLAGYTPADQPNYTAVIHKDSATGQVVDSILENDDVTSDSANEVYYVTYTAKTTTVTKETSQTVKYQGVEGDTPADNVQSDYTFTGTHNEATDQTAWNEESHTYNQVKTPVVTGYVADKASVAGATVTPDNPTSTTTVTYTKVGQIIPVDENGNKIPGATPISYKNNPDDPTKVLPTDVPTIPGYTAKVTTV